MSKRIISIIMAFALLLATVSSLAVTSGAYSTIGTYMQLNTFYVFYGGNTTVLEDTDSAFQTSVKLYDEYGSLLTAEKEQMSVSILELPDVQPYRFGAVGESLKHTYVANYNNPKVVGDYTLRFSFSGKDLYEPCHIDIPFSVVEKKEETSITIFNDKISPEADDSVQGRLTDSKGEPLSNMLIKTTQTASAFAYSGITATTDADGYFSFELYDEIINEIINYGTEYVSISVETDATDTYSGTQTFKRLTVADRYRCVWLDGDGSELDSKYYYEGDELPTTDKIPEKYTGEGDGYAFEKWDNGTVDGSTTTFKPIGKKTLKIYPIVQDWTYGEDSSTCISISPATNPDNVRIQYFYKPSGADDSAYTTEKPTDAGDYTVQIIRPESANFASDCAVCSFTIHQADTTCTVPTGISATYGDTLSSVELPEGWTWDNGEQSVGSVGSHNFSATFTPADATNYKKVSADIEVSVAKKSITIYADDIVSYLGNPLEELTYTLDGELASGDDLGITLTTSADNQTLGEYDIFVTYNDNPNYDIMAVGGTYTVSQAESEDDVIAPPVDSIDTAAGEDESAESAPEVISSAKTEKTASTGDEVLWIIVTSLASSTALAFSLYRRKKITK